MGEGAGKAYSRKSGLLRVLKQKAFARWQARQRLPDSALCNAVTEMDKGLIDADLGGALFKKRIARAGGGKSGGYRTVLSARIGHRYVFLRGFAKCERENITPSDEKVLRFVGRTILELSHKDLARTCEARDLMEVCCDPDR